MDDLGHELTSVGLETIGGTDEKFDNISDKEYFSVDEIKSYPWDPEVGAVVTGMDFKNSFSKIVIASMYI